MAENDSQQNGKKDWSDVESIVNAGKLPQRQPQEGVPSSDGGMVLPERFDAPASLTIAAPDPSILQGVLMRWKSGKLGRKAALELLQLHYDSQLDLLREGLVQAVKVHKTRFRVDADEYLKILDGRHLEALTKLGMRNAFVRWKAVIDLKDMLVAKLNEVRAKDWPPSLKAETIKELMDHQKLVAGEMMRELGSEYSKD